MTIGMGIALGALCLRLSTFVGPPNTGAVESGRAVVGPAYFSVINFRWAFTVASVVVLMSVIGYVKLPRDAGDAVRGR